MNIQERSGYSLTHLKTLRKQVRDKAVKGLKKAGLDRLATQLQPTAITPDVAIARSIFPDNTPAESPEDAGNELRSLLHKITSPYFEEFQKRVTESGEKLHKSAKKWIESENIDGDEYKYTLGYRSETSTSTYQTMEITTVYDKETDEFGEHVQSPAVSLYENPKTNERAIGLYWQQRDPRGLFQLIHGTALEPFLTNHFTFEDRAPETMQGLLIKLTGTPTIELVQTLHLPEITGKFKQRLRSSYEFNPENSEEGAFTRTFENYDDHEKCGVSTAANMSVIDFVSIVETIVALIPSQ